jgi:ABC-type Na+ efflux pump permease subunit
MAVFPPVSRPSVAFRDLLAFMRQRSREQVIGFILAVLVTIIIVIVFLVDSKINTAPPPRVVYVELYDSNRTDAEIIADQKKDQAEKEAYAKAKQRQFQELEKKLGMD